MEGMSHAERDDFPDLQRAKPRLDINTGQVMSLAVNAHARERTRLRRKLTSADPAVQYEPTALVSFLQIGRSSFNQASRKIFYSCRRRWLKAQDRDKIGAAIRRYRAKDAHERIRTGLKHDGLAVSEVDEDF